MSNYAEGLSNLGLFLDKLINQDHVPRELAMRIDAKLGEVVAHIDILAQKSLAAKKLDEVMPYIETLVASVKDLSRPPK